MGARRWGVACAALLFGCGEQDDGLYTAAQATETARAFHEALVAGDGAGAAARSMTPFRFQERDWAAPEQLQANWRKEAPRVQHLVRGLDRFEAFSRARLLRGEWPRNEQVPEDRRAGRLEKMNLGPHGFLVRVYGEGKAGYLLIVNERDPGALAVQGIDL
ncbi:MAG TPA: hypothetical protein VEI02_15515 [Planctomycetota bacterium]|nr:hypothetical protein [Planctomycetota bacterium]